MHTGGLLQRLIGDFPGLRWSLSVLTVLYLGASGNMGRDADNDTSDSAQIYPALQQVALTLTAHASAASRRRKLKSGLYAAVKA